MMHVHLTSLSFIELELLLIEVLYCRNRDFGPYFSCDLDLDLDPMTFMYELDPCSTSRLSKVIILHTNVHTYIGHCTH